MLYTPESVWELNFTPNVTNGMGSIEELDAIGGEFDAELALIVTDPGLVEAGIIDNVAATLDSLEYTVFDDVEPDPDIGTFEAAIAEANAVDPDLVIGVGGGSAMDVAKTTSVVAEHGGDVLDYVAQPTGEGKPVPGVGIPTVAVPTTAGTGAETSPVTVISLPEEDLKVGISSRHQRPEVALLDPALSVSLPPAPTASSGMDALSHAIEAYVTRPYDAKPAPDRRSERPDYNGRSPITDLFAKSAIERIGDNLRTAVDNGQNLDARREMLLGSFMAGVSFTNAGLGATHAIAMAAGAIKHTPHGVTIAHALPAVMRYNATSAYDRYAEIATILGEDTSGLSRDESADLAAHAVEKLAADVGIDGGLSSLDISESDVPHLAERANQLERLLVGNPRRIDRDALEVIIRDAL